MKFLIPILFVATMAFSSSAVATDEPITMPDGPVWSPPGWSCTSTRGVVTCVQVVEIGPEG